MLNVILVKVVMYIVTLEFIIKGHMLKYLSGQFRLETF